MMRGHDGRRTVLYSGHFLVVAMVLHVYRMLAERLDRVTHSGLLAESSYQVARKNS